MNPFENAEWLWDAAQSGAQSLYLDFYDTFSDTSGGVYTLYISADANYALYVNGALAFFGQYADYENYKIYDTLDITPFVRTGENVIKVTVHGIGRNFSTYRMGQPGVIYSLFRDGTEVLSSSVYTRMGQNPSYQSGNVDIVTGQLGFSYIYDASKETVHPKVCSPDVVKKTKELLPRPIEKLRVGNNQEAELQTVGVFMNTKAEGLSMGQRMEYAFLSTREAETMTGLPAHQTLPNRDGIPFRGGQFDSAADGVFALIDLGAESTGVLSLDIEVPTACDILIGYGEHLDDLRPRSYVGARNFALLYRAKAGRNTFVGPFLRLGLRYLELNIHSDSCRLYYAGIKPTDYPLDRTPYFRCADHLHNQIYEVSVRTLERCMHEHYEDCPWREQSLYTMDSRTQMLCGYYAFGETAFARESLRIIAKSLREDGMLELCSPAVVSITIPSFSAVFIIQLEEYLRYSGDTAFVKEMLPTARAVLRAFTAQLSNPERLLLCRKEKEYWNFYEWQDGLAGNIGVPVEDDAQTYDAPMNAFFSMALRAMANLEKTCGSRETAQICLDTKKALDVRINSVFWDEERGAYATYMKKTGEHFHYAELTNALLVCADAAPAERVDTVLAHLAEHSLLSVSLSGSIFKYEAMLRRPEVYARRVFDDIADIWGRMLFDGATTFYETEEGADAFGNAGSLCHAWSAIPVYLYFAYVLGLKPTENGFSAYEIKPLADTGIYEAKGLAVTKAGRITL